MSLSISGGGSFAVTTESLLDAERMLGEAALRARGAAAAAGHAATQTASVALPALWALRLAEHEFVELAQETERLGTELRLASEIYGVAERAAVAKQRLLAEMLGPLVTVPQLVTAAGVAVVRRCVGAPDESGLVAAVRGAVDLVDVPGLLTLAQVVPGPALEETPVTAVRVQDASVPAVTAAPAGFGALAARIPPAAQGEPQVRVERYELPRGDVHWVVYVAGTSDWSLTPGGNPWDDTSNAVGLAGGSAGSTRATVAALEQAGWRPGDAVLPVGHSQGGMVATAIALSGSVPVPMLVTFGSPTAGSGVPKHVLNVAVEHPDDPVPALGGSPPPGDTRLLVREKAPPTSAGGLAAHSMAGYVHTATQLDASSDARAAAARATLAEFTGGQEADVTLWRGERDPTGGGVPRGRAGELSR